MVFLLWKHGFTLYWCRNSLFWFFYDISLTGSLICKIISLCWVICITITWEVTHFRWSAYIRANSLLIFLSEAIWLVGRGSVSVWKSVVILHVLWSQPPLKAETSPLGIYFTVFIGICLLFSDFDAFLDWVKFDLDLLDLLDFRFAMCFSLVLLNQFEINLIL